MVLSESYFISYFDLVDEESCESKTNLENEYCISSNNRPQRICNLEAFRCCANWRTALKTGRPLLLSKRNYSHEISKLCNFLFSSNNK